MAQNPVLREEKLKTLEETEKLYQGILEAGQCLSLKELAVTGRDLISAGQRPGPELGKVLNRLLELVLEHPEYNTKEILLERVKQEQKKSRKE